MNDRKREKLTPRESDVWGYILGYITDYGRSPAQREIGHALGISHVQVGRHLHSLKRKKYIRLIKNKRRNIKICTMK